MREIHDRLMKLETELLHLNQVATRNHEETMSTLKPMVERVQRHSTAIAILRRDRKWFLVLSAIFGGGAAKAIERFLG